MDNKQLILIGIIVILASIVVGGGIGLINSIQSPLSGITSTESTFEQFVYYSPPSPVTIESQLNTINQTEKYFNNSTSVNNDTIKWLQSFDNVKYVLLPVDGSYIILERKEYEKLNYTNFDISSNKYGYVAHIKADLLETHNIGGPIPLDYYYIKNPQITSITPIKA